MKSLKRWLLLIGFATSFVGFGCAADTNDDTEDTADDDVGAIEDTSDALEASALSSTGVSALRGTWIGGDFNSPDEVTFMAHRNASGLLVRTFRAQYVAGRTGLHSEQGAWIPSVKTSIRNGTPVVTRFVTLRAGSGTTR